MVRGDMPIVVSVAPDPKDDRRKMVKLRFVTAVAWMMLSAADARSLARLLNDAAERSEQP